MTPDAAALRPTWYLDYEAPEVRAFAEEAAAGAKDDAERAARLFLAVRDGVRYDPYVTGFSRETLRASATLAAGAAFCVPKAILLVAAARAVGIPARLGFADVRNHLATARLLETMGTDLFVFHGYAELWIEGAWRKATPTFHRALCEKFGVRPLEFDGRSDALFHPYDAAGRRHMEYVRARGVFDDMPFEAMMESWREAYPALYPLMVASAEAGEKPGDFEAEAEPIG